MKKGVLRRVLLALVVLLVASAAMVGVASADGDGTPKFTPAYTTNNNGVVTLWGEIYNVDPTTDLHIDILAEDGTKMGSAKLNDHEDIYAKESKELTWHIMVLGEDDDPYWTTTWEEGYPSADVKPAQAVLYVDNDDGKKMVSEVQMNRPDDLKPVTWEGLFVAEVNGDIYGSIQAAINAAGADDTVTLLGDTTESGIAVTVDKDVIIDLNGKTVNGDFTVYGNATIKNGTIDSTVSGKSGIEVNNEADRTLNPTLIAENLIINSGRHAIRVDGGTAIIDGGTYTAADAASNHAVNISDGGKVTIKGGTFIGNTQSGTGSVAIRDDSSKITISGGTFTYGSTGSLTVWGGKATVTGGTFESVYADCEVLISGGTFTNVKNLMGNGITGGTFGSDVNAYTDKEHVAIENADGTWDVVPGYEITLDSNFEESTTFSLYVKAGDATPLSSGFKRETYELAAWNTEAKGTGATYADQAEITFSADTKLYAQWVPLSYAITPADTDGKGTIIVPENAPHGSDVTVLVEHVDGYKLKEITVAPSDGEGTVPQVTPVGENGGKFTMPTEPVTVTVTFEAESFSVSIVNPENGVVSTSAASNTAACDSDVTVTATANNGYDLDKIIVTKTSDGTTVDVSAEGKFTMPASNVIVTATFVANEYTVKLAESTITGGFVIGLDTTGKKVAYNDTATFTVEPSEGFKLEDVTFTPDIAAPSSYSLNGDTVSFKMPAYDVTVSVTFSQDVFAINTVANPTEGGTVTAAVSGKTVVSAGYNEGNTDVTVTAKPADGYTFKGFAATGVSGETSGETYVFKMPNSDVTVEATFEKASYALKADAADNIQNGAITYPTTTGENVEYGSTVEVKTTAVDGYEFESLTITPDGGTPYPVAGNTFTMPAYDVTVSATFKAAVQDLTLSESEAGVITASPASPKTGETVTISATIKDGYVFQSFTIVDKDGTAVQNSSTGTTATFTMPAGGATVTLVTTKIDYTITVITPENGVITTSPDAQTANVNDEITVAATPEAGYRLDSLSVVTALGGIVVVNEDGTFEMPASAVTISATFVEGTPDVPDNYETTTKPSGNSGSSGSSTWLTETTTPTPTETPTTTPTDTQAPTEITPTTPSGSDSETDGGVPVAAFVVGGIVIIAIIIGAVLLFRRR